MSPLGRRTAWFVMMVMVASAGCGQPATPDSATQAQDAASAANTAPAKKAQHVLIGAEQLPDEYRVANGQDFPGDVRLCHLTLKPDGVRGFAMKRYTYSAIGPFLYQYVFVAGDDANRRLLQRLDRTLQRCHRDTTTTEDGGKITFRVTPLQELPRFGQESTGFRRVPEPGGVSSEYVLIRDDEVSVLLYTVAPQETSAPRELLVAGAEAVTRTLGER